ncbi:MAG TPA: ATP-binding protein [Candidatus Binatus sp.]|nr:ATP-binding protein [Candidatus Binatus sp.]
MTGSVLVVDDDRHILEVLEMRLAAMGLDVTATRDPVDALCILGERGFDVALFDLRMEPLDGIALTRAAHEKQSRLPVLIMTAHGTIDNAVQAIKEGAFDFITKPFVSEELSGKLARALSERRWARDRDLLRGVGETLASSGVVEHVLQVVAERTMEATETERAVVFLRGGGALRPRASAGASPAPLAELAGAAHAAIAGCAPVVVRGAAGRLTLAAPLLVDGAAEGALVAENPSYVVATADDLALLAVFAAHAAVALKNAREQSRLRGGALAALGRVATQVAHELNNPLGGLKLYAGLLQDRLRKVGDDQGVEMALKVDRALAHLGDLASDITAYGRPPELRQEPVGVNTLVEECLDLAEDRIATRGVRVVRELHDTVREVRLDAREIRKAVLNLMLNGVDAMESGGTLTVRTRPLDGGRIEIAVEDTGCGMDEETRTRMFELFFTTKPNGTGLGMAITRSVVDLHGGRLEVESAPGRGTRVRIELPAT